jgi:hypothetical protein
MASTFCSSMGLDFSSPFQLSSNRYIQMGAGFPLTFQMAPLPFSIECISIPSISSSSIPLLTEMWSSPVSSLTLPPLSSVSLSGTERAPSRSKCVPKRCCLISGVLTSLQLIRNRKSSRSTLSIIPWVVLVSVPRLTHRRHCCLLLAPTPSLPDRPSLEHAVPS